jgi:hypothetical protein
VTLNTSKDQLASTQCWKMEVTLRTLLTAAVIIAAIATSARAAEVGSGPAYGGPTQDVVVCYYSNVGTTAITFSNSVVMSEASAGTAIAEVSEFCNNGTVVPAGQRCRTVSVSGIANLAHWCKATVSSKAGLRGRMEVRNSSGTVLTSQPIQ